MGASRSTNPCQPRSFGVRNSRPWRGYMLWLAGILLLSAAAGSLLTASPAEVPVINGNLGPCTADFTVTDSSNQPIYDAKIHVTILYGFMSKRKSDLEIGTNSDGKARFEGLPDKVKKPPLEFKVWSDGRTKTVSHDPAMDCHPSFTVVLAKP